MRRDAAHDSTSAYGFAVRARAAGAKVGRAALRRLGAGA
jgi:hypothetical protein